MTRPHIRQCTVLLAVIASLWFTVVPASAQGADPVTAWSGEL